MDESLPTSIVPCAFPCLERIRRCFQSSLLLPMPCWPLPDELQRRKLPIGPSAESKKPGPCSAGASRCPRPKKMGIRPAEQLRDRLLYCYRSMPPPAGPPALDTPPLVLRQLDGRGPGTCARKAGTPVFSPSAVEKIGQVPNQATRALQAGPRDLCPGG